MALAGMDPAVGRSGWSTATAALFYKTYRHLYERDKREKAKRLEALVRTELDEERTRWLGAPGGA
jgi:hypothetical protein